MEEEMMVVEMKTETNLQTYEENVGNDNKSREEKTKL